MFVKVYRFMAWYRFVETMECEDVISPSIFLIFSTPTYYGYYVNRFALVENMIYRKTLD